MPTITGPDGLPMPAANWDLLMAKRLAELSAKSAPAGMYNKDSADTTDVREWMPS